MKNNISYFNISPFIFEYRLVYMTETTLNINSNVDISSISLKSHM